MIFSHAILLQALLAKKYTKYVVKKFECQCRCPVLK